MAQFSNITSWLSVSMWLPDEAIIRHNFAPKILRGDALDFQPSEWPDVDIFHAGFPCQPFSVAGHGLRTRDPRGSLFRAILRLVEVRRFPAIILENVRGLVSHHRDVLDYIVAALVGMGYEVHWKVLNARYSKLPQNRERLFIVAMRCKLVKSRSFRWPVDLAPVDLEPFLDPLTQNEKKADLSARRPPLSRTTARRNVDLAYAELRACGLTPSKTKMVVDVGGSRMHMMHNCSPCLTKARAVSGGHWLASRGRYMSEQEMMRLMGVGIDVPTGWTKVRVRRPDDVTNSQWRGIIGNAIPVTLLQRVLVALFDLGNLGVAIQDRVSSS